MDEKEIRLVLKGKDVEKFNIIKTWYNEKMDTGVFRTLLTEKYQEIKKIKLLGKANIEDIQNKHSEKIETIQEESI